MNKKYIGTFCILVLEKNIEKGEMSIMGVVSKIRVFNDENGLSKANCLVSNNPNKGIHFKYVHSAQMYANFLCANLNPQVETIQMLMIPYEDIMERYAKAQKERRYVKKENTI